MISILIRDCHHAVQGQRCAPPPHPQTEAQGDQLGTYNADLRQRGSLTLWFSEEAIAGWRAAPRTIHGGQTWYSPLAILTALTLKAVFRLALRQTAGLIGSIIDLLGLNLAVPTFCTLSRRAGTVEVPRCRTGSGADNEPLHLLVDSTGLKLCGAGEWLVEKHGTKAAPLLAQAAYRRRCQHRPDCRRLADHEGCR